MKPKFVPMYMEIAEIVSKQSSAKRLQVGAIVVKDDRVISIGYNGMPAGWTNECEEQVQGEDDSVYLVTKQEVIHAEANAIAKLARDGESGLHTDLFCTHAPCIQCAKMIYGAGIKKVYYRNSYRDTAGIDFLQQCYIETEHVQ